MPFDRALLLTNAAATLVMCGVITFVHVVHYPLFAGYERDGFRRVMLEHQRLTTRVVFPFMAVELVTSLLLLVYAPGWLPWAGAALVGVWGFSTVLVQVPLHGRLARDGFDPARLRRLIATDRVRVAAWWLRAAVVLVMLGSAG